MAMIRLAAYQLRWCTAAGMWDTDACELHDGGPQLLHGSSRCMFYSLSCPPTGAY